MNILDDIKLQYKIGGIANKFIYWNVGCFILSILFFYKFKEGFFNFPVWVSLSSNPKDILYYPWTLLTYSFLHAGFFHLFFNMMILNFSSRLFLTYFTQKQYLGLYVLSAIFAGGLFSICYYFFNLQSNIVGASGAVMAILVATTTYQPLMEIRLMFIGNIKLWYLTGVLILLDFLQILTDNTGGHIAHIGGAIFGFLFIKLLQNGTDLSKIVSSFLDFFVTLVQPKKRTPFKSVHVNVKKPAENRESKIIIKDENQQQIDTILDKIGKSGYDSLTQAEQEFLFKAGEN